MLSLVLFGVFISWVLIVGITLRLLFWLLIFNKYTLAIVLISKCKWGNIFRIKLCGSRDLWLTGAIGWHRFIANKSSRRSYNRVDTTVVYSYVEHPIHDWYHIFVEFIKWLNILYSGVIKCLQPNQNRWTRALVIQKYCGCQYFCWNLMEFWFSFLVSNVVWLAHWTGNEQHRKLVLFWGFW